MAKKTGRLGEYAVGVEQGSGGQQRKSHREKRRAVPDIRVNHQAAPH